MKPAIGTLRVSDDLASLSRAGADYLCATARSASSRIVVALSGGNTPKPMYELLAQEPVRSHLPWERVHWILGDERFVPPSSPDSNYGMACATFLSHVPVPPENSRALREALKAHGVPVEYLELPEGGHGLFGCKGPMWEAWKKRALEWMAARDIIPQGEGG